PSRASHPHLPSFPTRRSSDLGVPPAQQPSDQPAEDDQASGSWSPPLDSHVHTEWSWDAPREASMVHSCEQAVAAGLPGVAFTDQDRKSTRLNSSHVSISYAVF